MKFVVTGGTGMVGRSFLENAAIADHEFHYMGSSDCDLTDRSATFQLFDDLRPDYVIHLAARVGGVKGNSDYIADFYSQNIQMNTNVLDAAHMCNVKKLISLLSTCVYPDSAVHPVTEDQIHNGKPHQSNFGYAHAKRMLDVQSRAYRQQYGCNFVTAVPNNLYGENDNFHLTDGHVIPAMIRKVYEAKMKNLPAVTFWGNGQPIREFTYTRDLSEMLLFLFENYDDPEPINVGCTDTYSISDVAQMITKIVGYEGEVVWDVSMPAGQLKRATSIQKLTDLGWDPNRFTPLSVGLEKTCAWFVEHYPNVRGVK